VHPHVQAIVKNMNDYIFDNIDKTAHDADNTQAAGMEDFTDSLQWVMASLDDDDSDSDDNAAEAAPPATLVPLKARNGEWVRARPDVSSTVLLWTRDITCPKGIATEKDSSVGEGSRGLGFGLAKGA